MRDSSAQDDERILIYTTYDHICFDVIILTYEFKAALKPIFHLFYIFIQQTLRRVC